MYERMYRERWLDLAYRNGHLRQIINAQDKFIMHLSRCDETRCVYIGDQCATNVHLFNEMVEAKENYERYDTNGCSTETVADTERQPKARPNQGKAGTDAHDGAVRASVSDDEWFGGIV